MLEWSDEVTTGIYSIDSHNKNFHKHLNSFLAANAKAQGRHEVEEILIFLEQYAAQHTEIQERYMTMHEYPYAEDHKADHREFHKNVKLWLDKFNAEGVSFTMVLEVQNHMGEWFVNHIGKEDKRLAAHISSKTGVT